IALIWMVSVYARPVTAFPDEAIVAYAQGVGLAHQEDYVGAIDAFDRAVLLAPDYANAYYARANAYSNSQAHESAAASYEAALESGREDVNVYWNLGWNYYLLGRFDKAQATNEIALEAAPDQVALQFNQALAYLADGQTEAAETLYQEGLQTVADQVETARANGEEPPATLWWYMNTAASDLDNFLNCVANEICVEAPPYSAIADQSEMLLTATSDLRLMLKSAAVTLEFVNQLPADVTSNGSVENVSFAYGIYNDNRQLVDYEPLEAVDTQLRFGTVNEQQGVELDTNIALVSPDEARPLFILFDYQEMTAGDLFVMKVYKDGRESPGLRLVETWALGDNGEVSLPLTPGQQFVLTPGDYRVELYVGSTLTAESGFSIQ
ncbi:MAG: tetratricopeptide repeat protein, partial [Anaerolineales bacterium]|nr:tetratricopeptide repeat protein [Anaerolineales bacterium]